MACYIPDSQDTELSHWSAAPATNQVSQRPNDDRKDVSMLSDDAGGATIAAVKQPYQARWVVVGKSRWTIPSVWEQCSEILCLESANSCL